MSYVSLSGLSAAQLDLNTTSNNIANANTYGFKESRAEFADVYSNSLFTNAKTTPGGGAQASQVAQQFHEGSSIYTNNPMDLRVSGTGFFAVAKERLTPQQNELTRNGAFHLNKENYMVTANDEFLLGYQVDPSSGEVSSYEPQPINIPAEFGKPKQTANIEVGVNLPANGDLKDPTQFDFSDPDTYNRSTSSTIYDSMGQSYKLTTYYLKDQTQPNTWNTYYTVTDKEGEKPLNVAAGDAQTPTGHVGHTMKFNNDGTLASLNNGQPITSVALGDPATNTTPVDMNGADPAQTLNFGLGSATQFAAPFELTKFDEDGATTGFLTKVDFDENGSVLGTYSNGENVTLGRVALVRVPNEQGLDKKGGTQWDSTQFSGDKIWGESNKGSFGTINNGMLEQSNIDMTQELVDLISAQRNFQANSRSLEVHNQLQQNILQIR
ncbi:MULTISPECIES: flagellar hook protein FlgE [Vibrio]|jgi:flagellar hook protein FlgE|uniref:Flagellar hook protein FlgE n=3 Tax=Vibrio harveyi group TaxID=717610 RepID=A0A0H0YA78_VIBAL|nr:MULTISPECIES: flagellar hook protein FlgE [Vibrio]EEZ84133.1 flagellar hook protein [Vibrio alginolyticus 40B]KOY46453.1 flagellar biosynthesis protein FlgE [Vibrio parahaemolyticus]MDW1807769.1 flagellar hook protein FlgE [Vibrio sp. Vb2362]MDW1972569.1 flagellar hook protein FlgE [Vibrio sp. 945]MDW2260095.1 flagellar hook protein FlgE [Vibrio sp. 1409]MDW2295253.1 flagellar hook protein FlgE [Vibrio sp. 1404]NAW54655.1 flagellar hook protein FlgE [Vibrio sp. V41_P2S12T139]NAW93852.1 f